MTRIFVTGAAGYIGSMLVKKLLDSGFKVRGFDSLVFGAEPLICFFNDPNFELVQGDIINPKKVSSAMHDCDGVIHLAALVFTGGKALAEFVNDVNYRATRNLVDLCIKRKISRFIFASTCSSYGISKDIVTEDSTLNPTNVYSKSKIMAEQYILAQKETHCLKPTILRLSTVFGLSPRMRFDLTVNDLTLQAVLTKKLKIFNPNAWRPGLHIDDATEAIKICCERWSTDEISETINIGDSSLNYQKNQICDIIKRRIPSLETIFQKTTSDARDYRVSFDRMRNVLKFKPEKTLADGIYEIMDAVQNGVFPHPLDISHDNLKTYQLLYHDKWRRNKT